MLAQMEAAGLVPPAEAAVLGARGVRGASDVALADVRCEARAPCGAPGGGAGGRHAGAPLDPAEAGALDAILRALEATGDVPAPPRPASELLGGRRARTGCATLDTLLAGGLRRGVLTELCGGSATGKTQLAMLAAAAAAARGASVVYMDSANSFSARRVAELLAGLRNGGRAPQPPQTAQAADAERRAESSALNSIALFRVHSAHEAIALLDEVLVATANGGAEGARAEAGAEGSRADQASGPSPEADALSSFFSRLELVVVDSAGALLAPVLGAGSGQGHAVMAQVEAAMKRLASSRGGTAVSVLCTNHVVGGGGGADGGDGASGQAQYPALGMSWRRAPAVRVRLERDERQEATRCALEPSALQSDAANSGGVPASITLRIGRFAIA